MPIIVFVNKTKIQTKIYRSKTSSRVNNIRLTHNKLFGALYIVSKILSQPITTIFDRIYFGLNLFTNNGHHYNIVDSP